MLTKPELTTPERTTPERITSKTYAESKGQPVNWHLALRPNRTLTSQQWDLVELQGRDWVTCACGNQCAGLPRNHFGMPDDEILAGLGFYFARALQAHRKAWARDILARIETRSAFLLTEMSVLSTRN